MRRDERPPGRTRSTPSPRHVYAGIVHARDPASLRRLISSLRATRTRSGGHRADRVTSRTGRPAPGDAPGPLHLVHGNHLVFMAPSRALAAAILRTIERVLGDAIEHAEIRRFQIPGAAAPGRRKRGGAERG